MSSLAHASATPNPEPNRRDLDDLFSFESTLNTVVDDATLTPPNPWDPLAAYTSTSSTLSNDASKPQSKETIGLLVLGGLFFMVVAWGLFTVAFPTNGSPLMSLVNQASQTQPSITPNRHTTTDGFLFPVVEDTTLEVIDPNGNSKNLPIGTSMGVLAKARGNGTLPAVSFGRSDPFMPLVTTTAMPEGSALSSPVQVEFIGIIKDTSNPSNPRHVAMLQTKGANAQTLIKETGDEFMVNEQVIRLQSVHPERVELIVDDEAQTLMLRTYSELYNRNNAPDSQQDNFRR